MSNERTPRGKRRPFVQVPHLEELELGNRELAIFLRILWFLDDQAWRHDGSNAGAAAITEGTLRQLAGTTRLDHAEAWLKVAVSRFPRARWIPVAVAENGLITAIMELAKVLPQEEAPKFSLPAIQARYPRIRGFLWFPNPGVCQRE